MPPVPKDVPNTRFIDRVTNEAQLEYGPYGDAILDLGPNRFTRVTGYRKVHVRIGSTQATELLVTIGKIGGATLASGHTRPIDDQTHTFELTGPELGIWLRGGPPNTTESVQCWVYLTS